MAKKRKNQTSEQVSEVDNRERIAIFYKRHTDVIKGSPQVNCNYMRGYQAGEIVWDEAEIQRLLAAKAPIGVYYKEEDAD